MIAKIYKLISEDEEERFNEEPIVINCFLYSNPKMQQSQVVDGLRTMTKSIALSTKQSRLNDLMADVNPGDLIEYEGKKYTIKSIDKLYMNFQNKGKRKYIIQL